MALKAPDFPATLQIDAGFAEVFGDNLCSENAVKSRGGISVNVEPIFAARIDVWLTEAVLAVKVIESQPTHGAKSVPLFLRIV